MTDDRDIVDVLELWQGIDNMIGLRQSRWETPLFVLNSLPFVFPTFTISLTIFRSILIRWRSSDSSICLRSSSSSLYPPRRMLHSCPSVEDMMCIVLALSASSLCVNEDLLSSTSLCWICWLWLWICTCVFYLLLFLWDILLESSLRLIDVWLVWDYCMDLFSFLVSVVVLELHEIILLGLIIHLLSCLVILLWILLLHMVKIEVALIWFHLLPDFFHFWVNLCRL